MSRAAGIALCLLVLLALAASALYARSGLEALDSARGDAARAGLENRELQASVESLDAARDHAARVDEVLEAAAAMDMHQDHWTERRIRYRSRTVSRHEAAAALEETVSDRRSAFVPEAFQLGVLEPEFSLFETPDRDERGVNFELSGTLYLMIDDEHN